jgi:alkanesulfonate monooxygenase SsuD/methylene tetrahydromethanopterin reductase-like flavin-dependent oxidoreductase (luciferase family)
MVASSLPAVSLVATPTKRNAILELAAELDRRGFTGLACPSLGGALSLCVSLGHVTQHIRFWTSIQPIYLSVPTEAAGTAAHLHEITGGRFSLGLGVSHAPAHERLGVQVGKPLSDTRAYVAAVRAAERGVGQLPPIILATLRDKMLDLALEVADGAVWANASRSHTAKQLQRVPAERRSSFFLGNMIPTVIDADRDAARAIHRKTLTGYVSLPNYRNYWKAAGYEAEMTAIEAAIAAGERDKLPGLMTDAWVDDCTLSGTAAQVKDGVEAWREAGITTPILVMSSTSGGQAKALNELIEAYS